MDNKTRAEKIAWRIMVELFSDGGDQALVNTITPLITSQLDEAVREAVDAREEMWMSSSKAVNELTRRQAYTEGFSAAREKCESELIGCDAIESKLRVVEQMLGTERDRFGKRETELMCQLRAADKLAEAVEYHVGYHKDDEATTLKKALAEFEEGK